MDYMKAAAIVYVVVMGCGVLTSIPVAWVVASLLGSEWTSAGTLIGLLIGCWIGIRTLIALADRSERKGVPQ